MVSEFSEEKVEGGCGGSKRSECELGREGIVCFLVIHATTMMMMANMIVRVMLSVGTSTIQRTEGI